MNKHAKKKWVAALRSGKYDQTTGVLCRVKSTWDRPVGYCCLGVAVEELAPEFLGEAVDGDTGLIPDDLAIMFDIYERDQEELSTLNDGGSDFEEIANWIEENL